MWRLPDLVQTLTLKGHRRGVWSAAFSPVDQAVLTGSGDATVRLWALTDGSCLKTFEGHSASVLRASFISYGTQVGACRRRHLPVSPKLKLGSIGEARRSLTSTCRDRA